MSFLPKLSVWLPKLVGAFIISLLLCVFFTLYFFKYIPAQQQLLDGRAFRELEEIGTGLHSKTDAYSNAIQSFAYNGSTGNPLYSSFQMVPAFDTAFWDRERDPSHQKDSFYTAPLRLTDYPHSGDWMIAYPLYRTGKLPKYGIKDSSICEMNIALNSVLQPIITTYKDIFSDYLVLRDRLTDTAGRHWSRSDSLHNYEIVFSSGSLPIDYRVGLDSLDKTGFNLITIHDVTIEGTAYKLFLYPIQLGNERIMLAGMIEATAYRKGYNTIPFNLAIAIGVLVLLLFIHLPILKIYVLGKSERIRGFDIRMIIGTYFITAFLVFFLFSRIFLDHVQSRNNYKRLQVLSDRVEKSFSNEITNACQQLRQWDTARFKNQGLFRELLQRSAGPQKGHHPDKAKNDSIIHGRIDSLLRPLTYPYADYVYWIDPTGISETVWSAKKAFTDPAILNVKERSYFQDILHHNLLRISSPNRQDSFTIQPTLSKLDGEYNVNIVTRCLSAKDYNYRAVGFSTEMMYSVCNTQLPPGYNFSIIDLQGDILYDSRPGHALLSNISRETETASDIIAPLRYHSTRYFGSYILQGRPRALLVKPMKGFPYALLVYYDLAGSDDFQGHLIGLSAFFGAAAMLLLILSAFVKEWSEKRSGILLTPTHHFEWLQPTHIKNRYYRHLLLAMICFLAIYDVIWLFIEVFFRRHEFSMFFIALLFPFYIALHYYLLREKQRAITLTAAEGSEKAPLIAWPNKWLLTFLGMVVVAINTFASLGTRASVSPLFFSQFVFLIAILVSLLSFRSKRSPKAGNWFSYYILVITTGIFMINFVPACSIFWIVFRQESLVQSNTSLIIMAGSINQRRTTVNQRISTYKLALSNHANPAQPSPDELDLRRLKFQYGLYFAGNDTVIPYQSGPVHTSYPIDVSYTQIHRWLFHNDSTALVWPANPNYSSDSSWLFLSMDKGKWPGPALLYYNQRDAIDNDSILVQTDSAASYSAFKLMTHEVISTASPFYAVYYFGCIILVLVLLYLLTCSLARRIFMGDLLDARKRAADIRDPDHLSVHHRKTDLPDYIDTIYKEESLWWENPIANEQKIVDNIDTWNEFYYTLWKPLSDIEKFTLYDFALDGFTNYKNTTLLNNLIDRHILHVVDGELLRFITPGFREWILRTRDKGAFDVMAEKVRREGPWENIEKPLLLLLAIPGIFIFVTQDDIYQKVTGFLTALTPILSFVSSFFPKKESKQ